MFILDLWKCTYYSDITEIEELQAGSLKQIDRTQNTQVLYRYHNY